MALPGNYEGNLPVPRSTGIRAFRAVSATIRFPIEVQPGDRYGARTVVEAGLRHRSYRAAGVRCDCGKEQTVALYGLMKSESCGHVRPGNRNDGAVLPPGIEGLPELWPAWHPRAQAVA